MVEGQMVAASKKESSERKLKKKKRTRLFLWPSRTEKDLLNLKKKGRKTIKHDITVSSLLWSLASEHWFT